MKQQVEERAGFTLIEVVITMAILATAIAALLSVINIATKLQMDTEHEIRAKNEARKIMETMKGYTCDQIVTMYAPETDVDVDGFNDDASATIIVDNSDATLIGLTIRVRWKIGEVDGANRYRTFEVMRRVSDQDNG